MIEVQNVTKRFDTFCAVDGVSFSIQTGEIVGLLGPNGAGKTTTMRMIAGYLVPDGGCVKVDALDVVKDALETKRRIGYMSESAPMYSDMIVLDYLEYVAAVEGVDAGTRIPELVKVCGLRDIMSKNIGELSRGNKQRVGLAHALMGDAEILILDEPTSGLDPNQVQEVRDLIKEIGKTHTVIISTHILSEVEMLCDRVIIISAGHVVADSPTEELRERFGGKEDILVELGGVSEGDARRALGAIAGARVMSAKTVDGRLSLELSVASSGEIRPAVAKVCVDNGWDLFEMHLRKNSLEDVFRALTASSDKDAALPSSLPASARAEHTEEAQK